MCNINCNASKWWYIIENTQSNCSVFSYTDDSLSNDDYSDLETPVSTRNYFQSIRNLREIQNTLGDDSGLCLLSVVSVLNTLH